MRKVLLLIVLLVSCGTPYHPQLPQPAQTFTLVAQVFNGDPVNDDKVPGATLTLAGKAAGTTDGAGNLSIGPIAAGTYHLCAATDGFTEACQDVRLPGPTQILLSLTRLVPPISPLRVDGRSWANDQGTFRPVFASDLASLVSSPVDRDKKLDETVELGFNGVRIFAGDLAWAGQTAAMAEAALPGMLDAAALKGLYAYISALTDSGSIPDPEAHLKAVAAICAAHANCLLEVANEVGHETQADAVNNVQNLLAMARRNIPSGVVWTLGAPTNQVDEMTANGKFPTAGGLFNDAHLNRDRDRWNQVRRLREIAGIGEALHTPAMSGEPIGAAEASVPGKRLHDPVFFWTMGLLCRGFELGCVFHSEDGLHGALLGPNQTEDAKAFIAGNRVLPTADRLRFENSGWGTSPVAGANFDHVVRAYTFVDGPKAWVVLVGLSGDPQVVLRSGWRQVSVIAEQPGVQVWEITQ